MTALRRDVTGESAARLTDCGDMRCIKFALREPAQHARLPDPRVSQHEQPEQNVVVFGHDHGLKDTGQHDSDSGPLADACTLLLLPAAFAYRRTPGLLFGL